jgi:hypothetical protein
VGASGKDRNTVVLGKVRTYARLEPKSEFRYGAWVEAVRAGRTFVTDGPLLTMSVNGHGPGTVLTLAEGEQKVRIQAEAHSASPFTRLEVLHNGAVIASCAAKGSPCTAKIEAEAAIDCSGWVAARCRRDESCARVQAHTSPVYVSIMDRPLHPNRHILASLLAVLDQTLAWSQRTARCRDDRQRQQLMETLQAARQELMLRGA